MKREDLKKLELSDEQVDTIMKLYGKSVEKYDTQVADLTANQASLTQQLTEAGAAIEGFKKLDVAGIQKAADDYKAAAEKATTDAELKVAALKFDHALEGELKLAGVRDPADIVPHLKKDMLKLGEDGKVIGLKEQLDPLVEKKPYLFEESEDELEEEDDPKIVLGGESHSVLSDKITDAARQAAGLKT